MNLDPLFVHTKMHGARLEHWIETLRTLNIAGDIVECGVWRGGAMLIARSLCPERICWLFDTFDGMTPPDDVDGQKARHLYRSKTIFGGRKMSAASLDEVQANFRIAELWDDDLVHMIVGPVEKTLHGPNLPDQIALLRLDTDWYASTAVELEVLYPRLVSGGMLIVDDFGHWQGARKAVMEYFGQDIIRQLTRIDYSAVALVKS